MLFHRSVAARANLRRREELGLYSWVSSVSSLPVNSCPSLDSLLRGADEIGLRKPVKAEFGGGTRSFSCEEDYIYENIENELYFFTSQVGLSTRGGAKAILFPTGRLVVCPPRHHYPRPVELHVSGPPIYFLIGLPIGPKSWIRPRVHFVHILYPLPK